MLLAQCYNASVFWSKAFMLVTIKEMFACATQCNCAERSFCFESLEVCHAAIAIAANGKTLAQIIKWSER